MIAGWARRRLLGWAIAFCIALVIVASAIAVRTSGMIGLMLMLVAGVVMSAALIKRSELRPRQRHHWKLPPVDSVR